MNPGRELDALIAERVMGGKTKCTEIPGYEFIPNYSEDIAAAWEVVEKLKKPRPIFNLECDQRLGRWNANFYGAAAEGDTAPHAICLAALAALPEEKK